MNPGIWDLFVGQVEFYQKQTNTNYEKKNNKEIIQQSSMETTTHMIVHMAYRAYGIMQPKEQYKDKKMHTKWYINEI